jgi:hypothetical protein
MFLAETDEDLSSRATLAGVCFLNRVPIGVCFLSVLFVKSVIFAWFFAVLGRFGLFLLRID